MNPGGDDVLLNETISQLLMRYDLPPACFDEVYDWICNGALANAQSIDWEEGENATQNIMWFTGVGRSGDMIHDAQTPW